MNPSPIRKIVGASTATQAEARVKATGSPARARDLQWFFKTGPGEYGEGDVFAGITVPVMRKLAKEFTDLSIDEAIRLLWSPIHEARFLALLVMIDLYRRGLPVDRNRIYKAYLSNTCRINNWDLVDVSAHHIVGAHLFERDRAPLFRLARSGLLWDRRIAIISTFYFIRNGDFGDALKIAEILLADREDLIHKAVGWMLREIGKRDRAVEERFLRRHAAVMPRTMLRYAIEKFPEKLRKSYMTAGRRRRAS